MLNSQRPEAPFTQRTPRVVAASKLHRASARKKASQFLIEGTNCVSAAVLCGAAVEVFAVVGEGSDTPNAAHRYEDILSDARARGICVSLITDGAARSLAETVTNTGLFAVCHTVVGDFGAFSTKLTSATDESKPALVIVAVETSDPGNAGTIVRVADAMGATGVIFAGDTVDPENGKAARASAGSLFHLPVIREKNVDLVIEKLRSSGLHLLATEANGEINLDTADLLLAGSTAWLLGNEAHGLPQYIIDSADHRIRIPIRGLAESLNLATATAICTYASARAQQR